MATDTLYRVRTVLSGWQGGPGLSTLYFSAPTGGNTTDALAAVNRVRGGWDVFKTSMANTVTAQVLGQVDLIDSVSGTLTGSLAVTQPAVVTGTVAGAVGPTQVMGGLELFTANVVNGRRIRGHVNLGPLSVSFTQTPTPPAGLNTNIDATGVAWVTISPPATPALQVWHRPRVFTPGSPPTGGQNFDVLSSGHATKYFTLRSRRD